MIFKDIDGSIIRIPNESLCGIMRADNGKCYLWAESAPSDSCIYEVTSNTFEFCMCLLDDDAEYGWREQKKQTEQTEVGEEDLK